MYSEIIDNLVNPQGVSVGNRIYWPRPIRLNNGGFARVLYPNSLVDMRTRVVNVLGQTSDAALLPLWMTTQQPDGSILGYTQAWVICYTKPGYASEIASNIERLYPYTLNQITFEIDRFSVNKTITYNYDTTVTPNVWTALPSATPVPVPLDSEDFYALFPRKNIIPDEPQY